MYSQDFDEDNSIISINNSITSSNSISVRSVRYNSSSSNNNSKKSNSDKSKNSLSLIVDTEQQLNGDKVWIEMQRGNAIFAKGNILEHPMSFVNEITPYRRLQLIESQRPYATIVTCSDSRVPPEVIFQKGLGMLFVVRVAGNVIDPITLGSIEYGVDHLKTPLLVIMGHENCGAVVAASESLSQRKQGLQSDTAIDSILNLVKPSVEYSKGYVGNVEWWKTKESDPKLYKKGLEFAIKENVSNSKIACVKQSRIISRYVENDKVLIIQAYYSLETGEVTQFGDDPFF